MNINEIEINFANGFKVIILRKEHDGITELYVGLCNQNGYVITDRKLSGTEIDILANLLSTNKGD